MYERFTDRARRVMQLANQEAQRLKHTYIGREHILIALAEEGSDVAASVLKALGVDVRKVRLEVEKVVQPGPDAGFAAVPGAKRLIEYSIETARNLNHDYVGTEHLLLGLLRERESVAARVLINLGLTLEDVRREVLKRVAKNAVPEEGGDPVGEPPATIRKPPTPALYTFGRDLTEVARQGKLAPVIGRGKEIEQVIEILGRRAKNNPMLIGEPGVGRTAIVQGLAHLIAGGLVPESLRTRRIVALDLATLTHGGKSGQFETRMKGVLHEAREAKDVILFIGEFHTLVGGGSLGRAVDASNLLVPILARNEIPFIGRTTLGAYRKYIETDGALERRFETITINPPSREEALEILKGLRGHCEARHRVRITDEAVAAAVELSDLYQPGRFFPQKAVGLMDEAAAAVRLRAVGTPPDLKGLNSEIERLDRGKESAVAEQDFGKAARLRDQADSLKKQREQLLADWREKSQAVDGVVGVQAVIDTLSLQTGIPAGLIRERDTSMLRTRPRE